MKRVHVVFEASADGPLEVLEGRTPMQMARNHHASRVAGQGCVGGILPEPGLPVWRPECLLAGLTGVAPADALAVRRGPVEAAAIEQGWGEPVSFVYRGNLITRDHDNLRDAQVAGLSSQETLELAQALDEGLSDLGVSIRPTGPATLAVGVRALEGLCPEGLPPFGLADGEAPVRWPESTDWPRITACVERAGALLAGHPLNEVRVDLGEDPANGLWLWGGGRPPAAPRGPRGRVIARSVLGRGLAAWRGWDLLEPRDPWQAPEGPPRPWLSVRDLVESLRLHDDLLILVPAPKAGGGYGSGVDKVRSLDHVDQRLLGPLLDILDAYRPYRLTLAADSAVSTETLRPERTGAPVVLAGDGIVSDSVVRWEEQTCFDGRLGRMKLQDFLELVETV